MPPQQKIAVIDAGSMEYPYRLCAAALQGLLNRNGTRVFVDYGIYDDPDARRTNEVFLDDELWYGKYRDLLGYQDRNNIEYYHHEHGLGFESTSLDDLLRKNTAVLNGYVIWDTAFDDTVNIALLLCAQKNLLPVTREMEPWIKGFGLVCNEDLTKRWEDRVSLYQWAFENLFPHCTEGKIACVEPGWHRPEFADYLVQQNIFTYSLNSSHKGLGSTLLMLLAFGPPALREFLFALHLDGILRIFALALMGWQDKEVKLSNRIQRAVRSKTFPTIFGWHTKRDDELAFMLQLSANGLRLVPSHIAGNFSFHSQVKPLGFTPSAPVPAPELDPDGIYLTFTLSDGDQLMMMNGAELGNWRRPARGKVPFNWECQPLLAEIAPALLERYQRTATPKDCLIAGPSGAGYVVPPLMPDLPAYMRETTRICSQVGINVVTSYVADPPWRILRQLARFRGNLLGYLCGYAVVSRAPQSLVDDTPIVANESPLVNEISLHSEDLLPTILKRLQSVSQTPRFIGVHLFAYRTTIADIVEFVNNLKIPNLHVVRGDEFLMLAREAMRRNDGSQFKNR
jgi:hypothetical protein